MRDALYVLNGKWKLPRIIALSEGLKRLRDLQRRVEGITPKLLSKELKELEQNEFLVRHIYPKTPVLVVYESTAYSNSLNPIIQAMADWGLQHRAGFNPENKLGGPTARKPDHPVFYSTPSWC
ncbi:hypothetical protein GCM10027299_27350 [Larkinella ripae]